MPNHEAFVRDIGGTKFFQWPDGTRRTFVPCFVGSFNLLCGSAHDPHKRTKDPSPQLVGSWHVSKDSLEIYTSDDRVIALTYGQLKGLFTRRHGLRSQYPHRNMSALFSPIGARHLRHGICRETFFFCSIPTDTVNGGHNTVRAAPKAEAFQSVASVCRLGVCAARAQK